MRVCFITLCMPIVAIAVPNESMPTPKQIPFPSSTRPEAMITQAPLLYPLGIRQEPGNTCGWWFQGDITNTIACSVGIPCTEVYVDGVDVAFCSTPDSLPITTVYNYGGWPSDEGCFNGQLCCPEESPNYGEYVFDNGQTVLLACGTEHFTISATAQLSDVPKTPTPVPISTPYISTSPTLPTPTPSPASSSSSSNSLSSGSLAAIGVTAFFGLLSAAIGITACLSSLFRDVLRRYISIICCGHCREDRKQDKTEERHPLTVVGAQNIQGRAQQPQWFPQSSPHNQGWA